MLAETPERATVEALRSVLDVTVLALIAAKSLFDRDDVSDLRATDRERPRSVHRALRRAQRRRFESRVSGHLTAT